MTTLFVIRHGQTTWNAVSRWQGWADAPLSDLGRQQARHAMAGAQALHFGAIWCSDLMRARETAEILAEGTGLTPVVDKDLREHDVGEWQGKTWQEIDALWPGMREAWFRWELPATPGGESVEAFRSRLLRALHRAAVANPGGRVLMVSHGAVIGHLRKLLHDRGNLHKTANLAGIELKAADLPAGADDPDLGRSLEVLRTEGRRAFELVREIHLLPPDEETTSPSG